MKYFFYDILIFIAALLYLPFYCLRGRVHADIWMRLGFFKKDYFKNIRTQDVVWIHAVSVGEARAAESIIRLIRRDWPQKRIVVSTVTPTGHAIVQAFLKDDEIAFYAPLDISCVVEKFLCEIAPSLLVIMETELWPNLIRLSHQRHVKIIIVNGRISDRSYRRYNRFKSLLSSTFQRVDLFCMQNKESAQRMVALGAPLGRVHITGNIKFDISADLKESPAFLRLKSLSQGSLLMLAGSTHENEEEILIDLYKSLRKDFASLRLVMAPRHLERLDRIQRMIRLHGLEAVRFSRIKEFSSSQVVLVDTIGDLSVLYQLCDVAFIGGSLVKTGGHNPIEPALFGKPIVFGKHMYNFKEIRDTFLKENAAIEIDSSVALEYQLRSLLASSSKRKELGERAKGLLDRNRGAAQDTFAVLKKELKI